MAYNKTDMVEFNKEYYNNGNYFLLKENYKTITLYYSVADTLSESRKTDDKITFKKSSETNVKKSIGDILKTKTKLTKDKVKKKFEKIKSDGEMDELVDSDGTLLGSNIPIINQRNTTKDTTDQRVTKSNVANNPLTRGYRVYWGESEDEKDNVVSEVDYSDAFGYEETKDMDYNDTVGTLDDMGVDDPIGRAEEMGKDPKLDKKKLKGSFTKQRLSEKEKIDEIQRNKMVKMVEDILMSKKKKDNNDVISSKSKKPISSFLTKNLSSIKKLAEKEGISLSELIKMLKYDE